MNSNPSFNNAVVARWAPFINEKPETHLEYTIWYVSADGRMRWSNGLTEWSESTTADALCEQMLRLQTSFVQQRWTRIEVHIPNRDRYGHLQPGYIKDTGLLLMTREVLH